jgi:GTP cyclohydrolase II/FMN phosphatase YigB (HAD superfamily)
MRLFRFLRRNKCCVLCYHLYLDFIEAVLKRASCSFLKCFKDVLSMREKLRDSTAISLYFVDPADPILVKVTYRAAGTSKEILSVRGKTGGAFDTERTFQWTAAVQGLCILLLKKAVCSDPDQEITILGGQGSVAASLDYALDKQPAWLADMFGLTVDGNTEARKILRRTNPGRRSKGPVVIGINKTFLPTTAVTVFLDGAQLSNLPSITELLSVLKRKIGLEEPTPSLETFQDELLSQREASTSSEQALFKTPFVLRHTQEGVAFTRLYQHGGSMFFVASFTPPSQLSRGATTPVRLQLLCPGSSAFDWVDCDCSAQLEESTRILRAEGGVLLHLIPEHSNANLFSSYLGSASSDRGFFSSPHGHTTAIDHKSLCSSTYDAVGAILRDLGIHQCALITNSPRKTAALRERGFAIVERSLTPLVTPQNLGFLYAQYNKSLSSHINNQGRIAFCKSPTWHTRDTRTWIIGGEDTLWEDNIYYEDFVRKFIDHIAAYLGEQSRAKIRTMLDSCSLANTSANGYGPLIFEQTLKNTWLALRQFYGEHFRVPYPMHLIDRAAETLLQIPIRVQAEGEELLWRIQKNGERAVLFTQGPLEIQLLKTAQLHIAPFFDSIAYVSHKNSDTFRELLGVLDLSASSVVVVGNNLSTEIQPAVDLGIPAVHYDNPNGWASLSRASLPPQGYRKIRSLGELYPELSKQADHSLVNKWANGAI